MSTSAFAGFVSNGDIDDEDMAIITDWTDADVLSGVSSQITFDSKSCMKLTTGGFGSAGRSQDIGSFGTRTVFSFNIYLDAVSSGNNCLNINIFDGTTDLEISLASDGIYINNGDADVEVGTNLVVQDTWQEWTFDVDWTAQTVDVYLDNVLKGSDVDCSYANAGNNGIVNIGLNGYFVTNTGYIDWFKAGSNFATTSSIKQIL